MMRYVKPRMFHNIKISAGKKTYFISIYTILHYIQIRVVLCLQKRKCFNTWYICKACWMKLFNFQNSFTYLISHKMLLCYMLF